MRKYLLLFILLLFSIPAFGDVAGQFKPSDWGNATWGKGVSFYWALKTASDVADEGLLRFANNEKICWEVNPTGTDKCLLLDSSNILQFNGTINALSLSENSNAVPNATDNLSFFAQTTSSQLAGVLSDETGTGLAVFNNDPLIAAQIRSPLFKTTGADTADASTGVDLAYGEGINWEANPTGTDVSMLPDTNEVINVTGGTIGASNLSGTIDDARLSANVSKLGSTISFISPVEIADECAGSESVRRNAGDTAWECFTPAADIFGASIDTGEITDGTINGDDLNSNIAGRSLTLTAGSPDTIDADPELYTETKCLNINPNDPTTNWLMFRTDVAITITGMDCIVDAGTSVVLTPMECDGNGGTCSDIESALTCTTSNTTESSGIDNSSVDAGDYIRVTRGTVTGTVNQAMICLTFTKND